MNKRLGDADKDNSPSGIRKRAKHAEAALMTEAELLASEVGPFLTVCALLGAAVTQAKKSGVTHCQFTTMVIEMLYHLDHPEKPARR
jgi:hypothetical protein